MPVVTAAVAVFVERKVPTKTEAMALLMLVSGVIVSVFEGQASGSSYGITLSITGKPLLPSSSVEFLVLFRGGYPWRRRPLRSCWWDREQLSGL